MARILIVEDDPQVIELLRLCTSLDGHDATLITDGEQALQEIERESYDLILLDNMLPSLDGWEVCRRIRSFSNFEGPILMVTARSSETDKISGLDAGADDYITKPFSPRELRARIRANLRRNARPADNLDGETLEFAGLVIDPPSHQVHVFGNPLKLTRKEFQLLLHLARQPGRIFTRDHLLQTVWGYEIDIQTRTVDEHIRRLRQKLCDAGCAYSYIQTIWGVGYKFEVAAP